MPQPDPHTANDTATQAWMEALQHAYKEARAMRHRILTGERVSGFDGMGLHTFSTEVGRVYACQTIEPALIEAGFDPYLLRRVAEQDAHDQFRAEVIASAFTQEEAA